MFGIRCIKLDASDSPVCVFDEPPRHEVIQIIRNRAKGDRFVSEPFVKSSSTRNGGTECRLRLGVGARELQTKHRELASHFSEKPRACGKTTDQKDELSQSR